jgi:general secretion pathway protein D
MKTGVIALVLVCLLAACATDVAYREGQKLLAEGKTQEGLKQLETATKSAPENLQYRAAYIRARDTHIARQLAEAEAALSGERYDEAQRIYRDILQLHAENPRAAAGLSTVEVARRQQSLLKEAKEALAKKDFDTARAKLRTILAQAAKHAEAEQLLKEVEEKSGQVRGIEMPKLGSALRRPVTLEFRDAPMKSIFDALSRQSSLNFVFDKDVRLETRATVFAKDTAIADALDMLLATSQLEKKVLNDNTMLIYPGQANKRKEYQDLVVKSFFLANADPKQVMNLVKTMAKVKDVYVDEKLNMLVVRDTPEAVRLAERLVKISDRPEPEVMLEVEIMEVKRSRLLDLGVVWPSQFSVLNLVDQTSSSTTGGVIVSTTSQATRQLTIEGLQQLDGAKIGVTPNPVVNLRKDSSNVNILANPRIRVRNKEKAKIHIGDKVPVITANTTSTGVISESVSYLDVGLKLDVEPQIHLDSDVAIKVALEVSNIVKEIKSTTGTLTYQLGSRNASTTLRLKDGETQVLAGLISDEDRAGANKVPGLGDLPLIGRLFSSQRDENSKTEIVLLITPHVVRAVVRPELAEAEFFAGTEETASDQPLRLRPAQGVAQASVAGTGGAPATPRPEPATPAAPIAPAPLAPSMRTPVSPSTAPASAPASTAAATPVDARSAEVVATQPIEPTVVKPTPLESRAVESAAGQATAQTPPTSAVVDANTPAAAPAQARTPDQPSPDPEAVVTTPTASTP